MGTKLLVYVLTRYI